MSFFTEVFIFVGVIALAGLAMYAIDSIRDGMKKYPTINNFYTELAHALNNLLETAFGIFILVGIIAGVIISLIILFGVF